MAERGVKVMYGQDEYGTAAYASGSSGTVAQDEHYVDLIKLVPEFVAEKKEMRQLYTAQGYEVGYLRYAMEDIINQCFIATATWGLTRWEKIFGITTNLSLTYEQRREVIMAKLRGQGTTTVQMIKDTAEAFSGGDVDVIEDNPNHRFIVRFIGIKGIPRNMQGFIGMLEEIKPAHLSYEFEYRFTIWNELKPYTWEDLHGMTWDDVRILKEA